MKRILVPLFCIIVMLSCCSCGFFGPQKYVCDIEKVDSIQIVRLEELVKEEYRYEYTVLSQISDCETFVRRLNALDHSVNWGEPSMMHIQDIVIRINYSNGDFDEIHPDVQCFNRSGRNKTGYFFFDEEQFNSLISDYMEK